MKPTFEKLQRDSVQAELKLTRAKRLRIGALNRLIDARRFANKTRKLFLERKATKGAYTYAVNQCNIARGNWARSVVRSEAATERAFDAGFAYREATRARSLGAW